MSAISRVSDIGIGIHYTPDGPIPYVTTFIDGAQRVGAEDLNMMIVTGIGIGSCGDSTTATQGAPKIGSNNKNVHRVGDMGTCPSGKYVSLTGSPKIGSK